MVLGLDLQPLSMGPLHAQLSNLHGQRIWGLLDTCFEHREWEVGGSQTRRPCQSKCLRVLFRERQLWEGWCYALQIRKTGQGYTMGVHMCPIRIIQGV